MIRNIAQVDTGAVKPANGAHAGIVCSGPVFEHHFSPDELGKLWGLSTDTMRRLFEREPGVLVIEHTKNTARRRYRTLRIPESVALRVHRRMTNSLSVLGNQ